MLLVIFSPFGRGATNLLKHDIISLTAKVWQIKTQKKITVDIPRPQ
jgi:hypothetical protein